MKSIKENIKFNPFKNVRGFVGEIDEETGEVKKVHYLDDDGNPQTISAEKFKKDYLKGGTINVSKKNNS